ncbi:hypothetical protein JAO85_20815 [Comamonas sp. NyZ500]|uniref:hypothetical protein n=1 Tax=Comamonas sp. NyZ500 TaxID=2795732 RepID=UPI00192A71E7|nr:hypothetical protein [Comamonas sp. NyZ500]MBL5979724.1 hypothetical protein [Comamonas sp. NyZ500]
MNTKHVEYAPKPVQVRLKPELHAWLHQAAVDQERSANWIVNKVVQEAKERSEAQHEKQA